MTDQWFERKPREENVMEDLHQQTIAPLVTDLQALSDAVRLPTLTTEYNVPVTISYDFDEGWLVVTDGEGASIIVAKEVDGWYGTQIARLLAATPVVPPNAGDVLIATRIATGSGDEAPAGWTLYGAASPSPDTDREPETSYHTEHGPWCRPCSHEPRPDTDAGLDVERLLLEIRDDVVRLKEPTLGLKGGVNRGAVIDVINAALARLTSEKGQA